MKYIKNTTNNKKADFSAFFVSLLQILICRGDSLFLQMELPHPLARELPLRKESLLDIPHYVAI